MEANENSQAPVPAFEQDIVDTQAIQANPDNTWEQEMGLPVPEPTAPPTSEDTRNLTQEAPVPNFSNNEVTPTEDNDNVRFQYWQSEAAKLKNQ